MSVAEILDFGPQVQDEELQVSRDQDEDDSKEQEPWIGVVPVEMDDSKASTGNQESFADAMVNKVSVIISAMKSYSYWYFTACCIASKKNVRMSKV